MFRGNGAPTRRSLLLAAKCRPSSVATSRVPPRSLTSGMSLEERKLLLNRHQFSRPPHYSTFYDFDAWVYSADWPSPRAEAEARTMQVATEVNEGTAVLVGNNCGRLPSNTTRHRLPLGNGLCSLVVEDIKFAFNAWSLLRLGMYFGTDHPRVLGRLHNTTPSMDIAERSNRMFYEYSEVGASLRPRAMKIALMPEHPRAVPLASIDWKALVQGQRGVDGIDLVLGMENGMSPEIVEQCDAWVSIPQYGSVGSLSMMAAMSVALHHAHSGILGNQIPLLQGEVLGGSNADSGTDSGLLTRSKDAVWAFTSLEKGFEETRPHHDELRGLSDAAICDLLNRCRLAMPLQLAILWHNESADRNIGATVRNANAYLCEKLLVLNRRKFSRRGTIGTHHYTPVVIKSTIEEAESSGEMDGYVLWQLHQDYPYLSNHVDEVHPQFVLPPQKSKSEAKDGESYVKFVRHGEQPMQDWLSWQPTGTSFDIRQHPMYGCFFEGDGDEGVGTSSMLPPIYLDEPECHEGGGGGFTNTPLQAALQDVKNRGNKGVMLVVPEEGSTPHFHLLQRCERVIFLVNPGRLPSTQRGLTAGMSTAVALERLREATLRLR